TMLLVELEITEAGMTVNYYEWCSHSSCENRALLFQSFRESTLGICDLHYQLLDRFIIVVVIRLGLIVNAAGAHLNLFGLSISSVMKIYNPASVSPTRFPQLLTLNRNLATSNDKNGQRFFHSFYGILLNHRELKGKEDIK
ncbi:hypothetical protein, partial [Endozoicomonas atrinae]|uniref:hypothetical protein n=1 Tax=Endozoicomonas atrinae TaxID=1333660 RepID=UPI001586A655